MTNNIIKLIHRDYISLLSEKYIGVSILICLILGGFLAPLLKSFNLLFLLIIVSSFVTHLFMLEEKYRAEKYFSSLPVKRSDIVLARYIGVIVMMLLYLILGYSINLINIIVGRSDILIPPGYYALVLFITSLLVSIFFPLYFKYGFIKSKLITMTIFMIVGGMMGAMMSKWIISPNKSEHMEMITKYLFSNDFTRTLPLIGISILLFLISIAISKTIYSKKDL